MSHHETDPVWREALDWLFRVQAAPEDPALRAGLAQWLAGDRRHAKAYARAERIWRLTGALPPLDLDGPAGLTSPPPYPAPVAAALPARAGRGWRRTLVRLGGAAIAASLLVALAPGLMLRLQADHRTGTAERRDVTLEDGTVVTLNADSAIAIAYSGESRRVTLLSGDAFFHVAPGPGRPFSVRAGDMTITDIGTAFSVDLTDEALAVAVESGAVQVTDSGRLDARLDPGGRLRVDRVGGLVRQDTVPPSQIAAWRNGRLLVDNASIAQVVDEVRAYFPGYILIRDAGLAESRVSGVYNLGDPAAALRAALEPSGGEITRITPYLLVIDRR